MNDRVYTHEFIRIRGTNRANYMHHMTANWSPIAQDERNQLCYGVWGTVGTTGHWPQVVNMWEEAGFDGLAAGLGHELGRPSLQDEKLEKWWNEASNYREGGFDRVLIPAPWTRTVAELCADGVRGVDLRPRDRPARAGRRRRLPLRRARRGRPRPRPRSAGSSSVPSRPRCTPIRSAS